MRLINKVIKVDDEDISRFATYMLEKDEIDEQTIRDIINLNRARMTRKHKISAIDDDETVRIIR